MYSYLEPVDDGLPMREAGKWAAAKLDYLQRYIDVFETSMRDKWPERNYVDLMAGPGKNRVRETGEVLLGSPLLALTTHHPFTGYYLNELAEASADALRARCSASPVADRVEITAADCNQQVDAIVASLKATENQSLNLAFLDPQGLELRWQTVAKLASVRRMDLILHYPEGGLNRAMGRTFEVAADTAVDRFFGGREWRAIYTAWRVHRRGVLHRQLMDLYRAGLGSLGYVEVRRADQVGDEPLMRNVAKNAPLYRLLFASKHPLGEEFWRAVTRRDVYGQRRLLEPR